MRLWVLSRTDRIDYDEYDSMVVCALDEPSARRIAQDKAISTYWSDANVTARELDPSSQSQEGVIIASFNAG